jgi:hypothetical protein
MLLKEFVLRKFQRRTLLILTFLSLAGGLYAQTEFPAGDFWSLDAGVGMTAILVKGQSFQVIIDPKLWLSPPLMVGSRIGVNYSTDAESRNILTFEGQVYLRWNFLRLGKNPEKKSQYLFSGRPGFAFRIQGQGQ